MKRAQSRQGSVDRRVDPRDKVRKVGRILIDKPRKVVACIILDLSETGALLLVHDKVPDRFSLYYSAKRSMRKATVVRRQQETIGIRFEGPPEVLEPSDSRLSELIG